MKRYSYGLMSIFIFVCGLLTGEERPLQNHRPTSVGHSGSEYFLHDSQQDQSPQGRDPITIFFEDFEDDSSTAEWQTDDGWELTESDYWSPTHSFNSPNNGSTMDNTWNLLSPLYSLPEIGSEDLLRFGFHLWADMPDADGDGDNMLEDYYNVSLMDPSELAWHASEFNAWANQSYWCGKEEISGYLDSWLQFLDTPSMTVPSTGYELTTMMAWGIEDPAGATVAGTCTDGWDAANVRISTDGGNTWELLTGSDPYDFEYGYGWIWNDAAYDCGGDLDNLASGWGGQSDWHEVTFNLDDYAGEDVIIRFAFGSDPAYCTPDDASLSGFRVDDIVVVNSSGNVLFGDDADGDSQMTASGAVWVDQFYDYGDDTRPGGLGWEEYMPGYPFNGNIFLDISEYGGKDIIFKFQSRYDDNNDGGVGGGLFIDDFTIYLESTVAYAAPTGLTGEGLNMQCDLMWNDMNESGTEDFVYDNDEWSGYSIYMSNPGSTAMAGETFDVVGPSTVNSVQVYNSPNNTSPVQTTLSAYGTLGSMFDTDPAYEMPVVLEEGWNTIDLSGHSWSFNGKYIIAYEFSDVIQAELDVSAVPSAHSMFKPSSGGWETWAESIAGSDLSDGEWGVRANITYEGAGVTYNVYRDEEMVSSGLTTNSYSDYDVENNITYEYAVSATYSDGNESGLSESIELTPQSVTVYEIAYDDGTSEMGFNAGQNNYLAVRFNSQGSDPLIRVKWFQIGDGGAFYLKMYDDAGGLPGNEIFTSIITGSVDGWNSHDMMDEEMIMNGTFWIGIREFSSTRPFGMDTDSDTGNSYFRIGSGGSWEPIGNSGVSGNLMIRASLDNGGGGGGDVTLDLTHNDDWNLIGLPLDVGDPNYATLFPDAIEGTLYEFDNGYIQSSELSPGTGYWLRFDGAGSNAVTGQEISNLTLSLNSDWNMISGITGSVDVANIQDSDGIIIPGTVYGFDNGYAQADVIEPGNAYWLRTSEAGDVTLSSSGSQNDGETNQLSRTQNLDDEMGSIFSVNAANTSGDDYTLYFGFVSTMTDVYDQGACSSPEFSEYGDCLNSGASWYGDQYAPPAPPSGTFDAALTWGSDRYYSQLLDGGADNADVEHELGLALAFDSANSITISWNNSGWDSLLTSAVLQDAFGGAMINVDMLTDSSYTVDNPAFTGLKLFVTPSSVGLENTLALEDNFYLQPETFGLDNAYPNPFNPSTEISYSVSEGGMVDLVVYDVLGRKINTLVSAYHEPNRYRAVWNGTDENGFKVSAGVYFYRMSTESYSDVKKIILLK